jgi:hypothetical protein
VSTANDHLDIGISAKQGENGGHVFGMMASVGLIDSGRLLFAIENNDATGSDRLFHASEELHIGSEGVHGDHNVDVLGPVSSNVSDTNIGLTFLNFSNNKTKLAFAFFL